MTTPFHTTSISLFHEPRQRPKDKDRDLALSAFIGHIRDERIWKKPIEALRTITDPKELDQAKDALPGVCPQGTFTEATNAGFLEASGLISIDIDGKHNPEIDPATLRDTIAAGAHVAAAFLSPSGTGVKVFVRAVPLVVHPASYKAKVWTPIAHYVQKTYGVKVDENGVSLKQFCYVSYDPEARINAEPIPFEIKNLGPDAWLATIGDNPAGTGCHSAMVNAAAAAAAAGMDKDEAKAKIEARMHEAHWGTTKRRNEVLHRIEEGKIEAAIESAYEKFFQPSKQRSSHTRKKTAANFASKEQSTNGTTASTVGIDDNEALELQLTKEGKVRENLVNYAAILAGHPDWKGRLVFDEFTGQVILDETMLTDELVTNIGIQIGKTFGVGGNNTNVRALAIKAVAKNNSRDLLKEYLDSLPEWDQEPRLYSWIRHWAGATNDDYSSWVGGMTIVQMMARGLSPGTIARYVPILEGQEGTGKSALVKVLGAPWAIDFDMSMDSKEAHMLIQGRWVAEISELSAVSRTQEIRVKSFLSQTSDDYVPKYSNNTISRPRRTVFIGTTNEQAQYLLGQTGNTRFLPIRTGTIDLDAVASNREQLFAEALLFYRDRPTDWWLPPPSLQATLHEEQEDRRTSSCWEDTIQSWLGNNRKYVTLSDVMQFALDIDKENWPRHQKIAGQVMGTLGWTYGRKPTTRHDRGRKRVWIRPEKEEGFRL